MTDYQPTLPNLFGAMIRDIVARLRDVELKAQRITSNATLYPAAGTVDPAYTSGLPKVTFDGVAGLSAAGYPYLASYTPAAGDRVLLAPLKDGYVIVGKSTGI